MSSLFCPKCFELRPMNLTTSEQEITGPDEKPIKVLIESYHCAICGGFVRSESTHEPEGEAVALQSAGSPPSA